MQMRVTFFAMLLVIVLGGCSTGSNKQAGAYEPIETDVPVRPAGQNHVLQLTTAPMDTVRVGFIGLGMRGPGAVQRFTHIPGAKIVALCDIHPERVEKAQGI